jgi:hypothetical protein
MTKSLNDILKGVYKSKVVPGSTGIEPGVDYAEKSKDGREFVAKHKVEKHEDRVGNSDDVYNASKVKQSKDEKHGHTPDPKAKTAYKQHNEAYLAMSQKREPAYNSEGHYKMTYAKFGSKDGKLTKEVKHTHIKFPEGEKPTTPERVKNLVTNSSEHKQLKSDGYRLTHYGEHAGEATIKEAKDSREYDYEGEMAISQIKSIMNHSEQLMSMLKPNTNLPEWVQSKITLAKDYIQTAADYYATEMTEEVDQIDEISKDKLQRYSKAAKSERLDPKKGENRRAGMDLALKKILGGDRYGNKPKIKATREEVEIEEAKSCNMSEAGTMCEIHGIKGCSSNNEPRYNGNKKEGRQLITDKKLKEEQIDENLGKAMKKMKFWYKGTGPDGSGDPREMKKRLKADPELAKKVASSSEKLGGMAELQRRVAKKIVKEEQIDELNKKTLQSYKSKAENEVGDAAKKIRGKLKNTVDAKKVSNRIKGIQLASKKLKEEQIEEREMTSSEKKKEEKLKSKYDDSDMKTSMQKQYGDEKGKQVYFAYIRKKAMKSEQADTHIKTPSGNVGDTGRV